MSAKRRRPVGSFTVTGPFEADHPVPNVGAGISCAQTFATRNRSKADEITYYVRDVRGDAHARITLQDGVILTTTHQTEGRSQ